MACAVHLEFHKTLTMMSRAAAQLIHIRGALVQNPRIRGAGASSAYTAQHTYNLFDDHSIPSDCVRGVNGAVPIDTDSSPRISSHNRALIAAEDSYSIPATDDTIPYTLYGPNSIQIHEDHGT